MAKKGKSNLRQRKKNEGNTNASENNDEDGWEDINSSSNATKSKSKIVPLVLAGALVIALVLLVIQPTPDEETKEEETESKYTSTSTITSSSPILAKFVEDYKVLQTFPHDTSSFTQGLSFRPDNSSIVFETNGMYNESNIRILDLNNRGQVLKSVDLPGQYFSEGVSYFRQHHDEQPGKLVHFTWREQTGFIIDLESLETLQEFKYNTTTTEGWGIIQDPNNLELIVSDGSSYLHFWDPRTFQETKPKIEVTYQTEAMVQRNIPRQSLRYLNELEYDPQTNTVLANVYFQDVIVRIDPDTGYVLTIYNLKTLYTDRLEGSDVFNGIALSAQGDLWVTGKYWPYLYQIELGES